MLTQKQCPRCGGNIYLSSDYYGRYEQCLQCGYTCDLESAEKAQKQAAQLKEKAAIVS
jgi:ribosomal protein S27AE